MITRLRRTTAGSDVAIDDAFQAGQWTILSRPTDDEIRRIASELELEESLLRDATDEDEMPRFEIEDDKAYLYTRFVYRSGARIDTAPILFVIGESSFTSLSVHEFINLEKLLATQPSITTKSAQQLLLPALNQCLQSYSAQLAPIGRQVRTARNSLRDEQFTNKHFVRFVEIEDVLNDFLSELVPLNNIFLHLMAGRKTLRYSEDDQDVLEDLQLETAQIVDEIKGYLKTIVNIREAYSNIMTNNLNRQIKILTVLTIVLTIPTIVGSFFGMNVEIPFHNVPWAFPLITLGTISLAALAIYILKRKNWL